MWSGRCAGSWGTISALPFLFSGFDDAWEFMDGEIQAAAEEGLLAQNMRVLAHYDNGFRCVTNSKGSQAAGAVVAAVGQLNQMVGISASLRELNKVDPAHFPALAELAMQDTCMGSNLISVSPIEIIAVYTAAYTGAKR